MMRVELEQIAHPSKECDNPASESELLSPSDGRSVNFVGGCIVGDDL